MKKINSTKQNKIKKTGFTLFELLVSISIIGILTALASVAFSGAQKKARDARRMQDVRAIQTAAEQFYSQSPTYSYPASGSYSSGNVWVSGTGTTILASYPIDPKGVEYTCNPCTISSYCVCTDTEDDSKNANSAAACNFAGTKTHFCVKNQQ